jgi:hypothetical protein
VIQGFVGLREETAEILEAVRTSGDHVEADVDLLAAATPTVESELSTWLGSVLPARNLEQLATMVSMLRQRAELDERTNRAELTAP